MTNSTKQILFETKDVYFNSDYIFQVEFTCANYTVEYLLDFGLTWIEFLNNDELLFTPIHANNTYYRLTIPLKLVSVHNNSIRFRLKECALQYIYVGNKCTMNCFGNTYCNNGECKMMNSTTPLVCRKDAVEKSDRFRTEEENILCCGESRDALNGIQ